MAAQFEQFTSEHKDLVASSPDRFSAFVEANPSPILQLSLNGEVRYSNGAARETAVALKRGSPREILPAGITSVIAVCLKSPQRTVHLESTLGKRTFSWFFFALDEETVFAQCQEVTERVALQSQVQQLLKMETIGQLASGVAHDFNNLLTVIQGYCTLLQTSQEKPAESLEYLAQIEAASKSAVSVTSQLLAFSRKKMLQKQLLNLNSVIETTSRFLKRSIGETINLVIQKSSMPLPVHADEGMLQQILLNLAVNSRDAMPHGGTLLVQTSMIEITAPPHDDSPAGPYAAVSVTDTGTGIPAEIREHIFEPFFTTKAEGKGTGLGLATVFAIARQHLGWVEVESTVGSGTAFTVYVPLSNNSVPKGGEQVKSKNDVPRRGKILLVEDDEALRILTARMLRKSGYEVVEADCAQNALQVFSNNRPIDLLLTDVILPGQISGKQLAESLSRIVPGLSILFVSGYTGDAFSRAEFEGLDESNFLAKPYTSNALLQLIEMKVKPPSLVKN